VTTKEANNGRQPPCKLRVMKFKNETRNSQIIRQLRPLRLIILLTTGLSAHSQINYTDGHSDFGVSYENSNWRIHYRFDSSTVLNGVANEDNPNPPLTGNPSDIRVIVPDGDYSRITIDESTAGFLSFMNVSAGDTLWYLDWNGIGGEPYFGLATEDLHYGEFIGPITFTLSSISGPGTFAMWQYDAFGSPIVGWNAADGLGPNDTLSFSDPTHAHYNWGFTEPGEYTLNIAISGTHNTAGFLTDTQPIIFQVAAVPEPSVAALALFVGMVLLRRRIQ
jgi:surface-anchored protein